MIALRRNIFTFVMNLVICIFFILNCCNVLTSVNGRKYSPFLVEEDGARKSRPLVSECQFGKTPRELGSTWYADLGPPFGIMYCIKCECLPVTKKRRIVARVQCKNIKNECPKPTCDEPVAIPGRCCKLCPGDQFDPDILQDYPSPITQEEEERNMKHFGALLTGRTSYFLKRDEIKSVYSTNNPLNIVATGRFMFHKKNLYYSFYTSNKIGRPRTIQFIDETGHILEEHTLIIPSGGPFSVYQNATGKICGVWKRVPRDYRRLLREDKISVVLLWGGLYQTELALAGKVSKYPALSTELFSSLLEPGSETKPAAELMAGAGGTAIVSTSSGATSSIHMTLVLNGIFGYDEIIDVPLNIRLESLEKKQIILEDVIKVQKPAHDYNVIEFSSPVTTHDLRLLTRGKLSLTVESRKNQLLSLKGTIVTRVACEQFQTILAPISMDSTTRTTGLAWMYLNKDGALNYKVYTDELYLPEAPQIQLVDDGAKRKTIFEDLTQSLIFNQAIGMVDRLGPRVLDALYAENLAINLATGANDETIIHGKLISRPVADARDSIEPILLKRPDLNMPSAGHLIGMAWLSVDNECTINYEISIGGIFDNNNQHQQHYYQQNQNMQLYLEEMPLEAPGAPVSRKLLDEFTGHYLEGYVIGMTSFELAKLETSVCHLEIRTSSVAAAAAGGSTTTIPSTSQEIDSNNDNRSFNISDIVLLRGKLRSTKVPGHCFPYTDNNIPRVLSVNEHNDNHNIPIGEHKCFDSGRFYDEGEQWKSLSQLCQMCSCLHGSVNCEPVKCPHINCKSDEIMVRRGECCDTCISATEFHQQDTNGTEIQQQQQPQQQQQQFSLQQIQQKPRGCHLGDQFHLAGSKWHPYLPPNGFDTCAVCTCDPVTTQIYCPRVLCPPLNCSEKIAYRPDKKACCKKCPEVKQLNVEKSSAVESDVLKDQGSRRGTIKSIEEILKNGGCKVADTIYENGQEWHPVVQTHGEHKCIKCRCKDSNIACDRKRCTRSICNNRVPGKRRNAYQNQNHQEIDECCTNQCRRSRRHQNQKRLHKDRQQQQHHHHQQQQQQQQQQQINKS